MAFTWYQNRIWWAKTSKWQKSIAISAMYHHCANGDRQVQIMVSSFAFIQNCIIPNGFDPEQDQDVEISFLQPIIVYKKAQHGFAFIVFNYGTLQSLRNGIWRLKEAYYNEKLEYFRPALAKTRTGSMLGPHILPLL